jgi:uncharacterized protein
MVFLSLTAITAPSVAVGASFDCSKARTGVEKTTCAGEELSWLDEELAKAYGSVIASSDHADRVKREQKVWLRTVRDQCRDETCLKDAYTKRLAQLAASRQVQWKTFRDTDLGIQISYPGTRQVKVGCRGSKNCISLIGESMPHSDYLIAFEVFDGDLETVAVEQAVFLKKGNGWIAKGRFAEHPVDPLEGPGWQGLKSVVGCGISDSNSFHAGAGECMWGVLSDGKRSVVVDTQGIVGIDEESMRSIKSVRFIK